MSITMRVEQICVESSADANGPFLVPPDRRTPLGLCYELELMIASLVNLNQVKQDMEAKTFTGNDATDCAQQALARFETLFNTNTLTPESYDLQSDAAVYRPIPRGGHETEAWIMKVQGNVNVPWGFGYPSPPAQPTMTIYPCIRIALALVP